MFARGGGGVALCCVANEHEPGGEAEMNVMCGEACIMQHGDLPQLAVLGVVLGWQCVAFDAHSCCAVHCNVLA